RFEKVIAVLLRTDMAQVGPDLAALPVNLMTTDALCLRFLIKHLSAFLSRPAKQARLIRAQGTALNAACFVGCQLFFQQIRRSPTGRLEDVQLELFDHGARAELIDPLAQQLVD